MKCGVAQAVARPGILKWVGSALRGSTRTGGLGDGSPPAGSRGRAPVGGLGDEVPQKLKDFCNLRMKFVTFCDSRISFIHSAVRARVKILRLSCLGCFQQINRH